MYPVNTLLTAERLHPLLMDTCDFRFEMLQSSMTMTVGPAGRHEFLRIENVPVVCCILTYIFCLKETSYA